MPVLKTGTNTITPPTNWSASVPAGSNPLYASVGIASIVGTTGTDSSIPWGSPSIMAQDGADGSAGSDGSDGAAGLSIYQASIYRRSASAPATPAANSGSYNFGTNTLTPPSGWSASPPAGSNPLYVSLATFEIQGTTGTDSTQTWTAPALHVQDGSDGANGSDGADGVDGRSTYMYSIYRRLASAPGTPTGGSFNFGTNAGTPPTNWSNTIPAGSDPLYVSQALASISGDTATDSSLTWSSPVILAQDGADGTGANPILNSSSGAAPTTMSHTSVGNAINLTWGYSIGASGFSGSGDAPTGGTTFQLRRNGTVIDSIVVGLLSETSEPGFWSWATGTGTRNVQDTPGSGTHSYTITVSHNSTDTLNNNSGSISSREEQ